MLKVNELSIKGCFEIQANKFSDLRGDFVKTFHAEEFKFNNLNHKFNEEFYSVSKKNVLRGFHFQTPPMDCSKIVYCTSGQVLDVILDIRQGSQTYGKVISIDLSAFKANSLYISSGLAHAFLVISDSATMVYKTSNVYSAPNDLGILWNSVNFKWPIKSPILSERDKLFPMLSEYISPFLYNE
jgi:dTDP-4-dehydrorhamnose 3,5-epimerase